MEASEDRQGTYCSKGSLIIPLPTHSETSPFAIRGFSVRTHRPVADSLAHIPDCQRNNLEPFPIARKLLSIVTTCIATSDTVYNSKISPEFTCQPLSVCSTAPVINLPVTANRKELRYTRVLESFWGQRIGRNRFCKGEVENESGKKIDEEVMRMHLERKYHKC